VKPNRSYNKVGFWESIKPTEVSILFSKRPFIKQYSSDKTKTLVETAIYRVSKPTILYK